MPDQVKLEPPPGQDVLRVWPANSGPWAGKLCLSLQCDPDPEPLDGLADNAESRLIAACVGARLWQKEAERLWSERNKRHLCIEWVIEWRHAQAQIVAWERWGGLT